MRKPLLLAVLPATLFLFAFSFKLRPANDDVLNRIALQLQKFYALFPQERIYLHQDKSLYSLGETIWFKAYAPPGAIDSLSTVLYADLVGPDNKVRFSRRLKLQDGMAQGDFHLPDTLTEGLYQVRAYTNWMRNFDAQYFFTREINITSPSLLEPKASISFRTNSLPTGDSVLASLQFYKHPYEPLDKLKLKTQLVLDGKKGKSSSLVTDSQGIVHLPLHFSSSQQSGLREAYLIVQSEDKSNPFRRSYRLPVGQPNLDLQFFPEGGHLVAGIASRVGFKAVDISGKGQQVKGAVYDQQGNMVVDFKSEHLGMGAFTFTPEAGKTYTAQLQLEHGGTARYSLPAAKPKGVVLQVVQPNEHVVHFRIENNFSQITSNSSLYLMAHAADSIIFAAKADPTTKMLESSIPASRFPAGLIHFTLFDQAGKPLSERLVFVNHPPQLDLSITTDKTTYGKRQKVTMQVEARDAGGKPVQGNFSLAVRDALSDLNPQAHENNIYTQLYLQGELRGHVEQPAYYFAQKQPQARRHLELLLLTQGWRRFDWENILQDKFPATTHLPEQSISFSGRVEKETGKKNPDKSNLTLIFTPNAAPKDATPVLPNLIMAETNPDGSFRFVGLDFEDTLKVFIQARTPKGSSNQFIHRDIAAPPAPAFFAVEGASLTPEQMAAYRNRMSDWAKADRQYRITTGAIQLKQVDITAKKQEVSDSHRIYTKGTADARIEVAKELASHVNILQYLAGRVAGVQVTGSGHEMSVSIRGGEEPLFVLDGMRVTIETVNLLSPDDIEAIEVLKGANAAILGTGSGDGVIALYTKRGNPNFNYANEKAPGTINFKLAGYNKPSEFYSPRYDAPEERHNLPDFRSTLHWQPQVVTDANGKATITFFTSDVITEFVAVCEGISKQGIVGWATHRFGSEVKTQP